MAAGAFGGWPSAARADSAPLDPAVPTTPATVSADWRLAEVKDRASVKERNLDIGIPFGWYPVLLSSELAVGEVKPLTDYGITALACKFERDRSHPDNIAFAPAGVTFANGRTRPTFDLVLHPAKKK